jgi:hypothetical protein
VSLFECGEHALGFVARGPVATLILQYCCVNLYFYTVVLQFVLVFSFFLLFRNSTLWCYSLILEDSSVKSLAHTVLSVTIATGPRAARLLFRTKL